MLFRSTTASTATTDTSKTQEDLTTANDGAIVLTATDITLGAGTGGAALTADGSGNVLLSATAADMDINANVDAGSGHITLLATSGTLTQDADVITTSTGTIDVEADAITFNDGDSTSTGSGNIRYKATNAMSIGDITTTGDVSLIAASITDSGTTDTDVSADELRINVIGTGGVGTSSDHFETSVASLSADVKSDGLFITEADNLIIDKLNAIAVNRVGTDGAVASTPMDAAQEDLTSTGDLILTLSAGSLTVNGGDDAAGISSAGETLLKAAGAGNDITLDASITVSSGNLSLDAADDILLNADGDITLSTESKSIDLLSGGDISAADTNSVSTTNGNVWIEASSNITVESINAGTGGVYLKAGTDIIDGDSDNDITAADLILEAGSGIGSTTDLLDITVTNLTATADADGMFIAEADAIVIGSITEIGRAHV